METSSNNETKKIVVTGGGGNIGVEVAANGNIRILSNGGIVDATTGRILPKHDWATVKEWYLNHPEGRPSVGKVAKHFNIPEATVTAKMYPGKGKTTWKEEWIAFRDKASGGALTVAARQKGELEKRTTASAMALLEVAELAAKKGKMLLDAMKPSLGMSTFTPEEVKKFTGEFMKVTVGLDKASSMFKNLGINLHKSPKMYGLESADDNKADGSQEPLQVAISTMKKEKEAVELQEADKAAEVKEDLEGKVEEENLGLGVDEKGED